MIYFLSFLASLAIAWILTILVRSGAQKLGVVDKPDQIRKIHSHARPLLGGVAIFSSFWIVIVLIILITDNLPGRYIESNFLWGIAAAGAILMLGGYLDDKYGLTPKNQIIFPALAILAVIFSGIGIKFVSNPIAEGLWHLDRWQWQLFSLGGHAFTFVLLADLFTAVWLLGMMYTTKFLDGLDGLASGVGVIGALIIFILSLTDKTFQPDVALLAIVLAGAAVGFLVWNFHPARIFLGEGGSVWLGFMLGILAIISGGKVATALLIVGIPVLDVAWVIIRRLFFEKKSPAIGDRKHLHFRLLDIGLSHRKAVLTLWGLTALFGAASLFLQTRGKVYLLLVLLLVMIILGIWVTRRSKSQSPYLF